MDASVLIQSILIVPRTPGITTATPDLGELLFHYSAKIRFRAPVVALMNRYHGLVMLEGLAKRFQFLVNPSMAARDLEPDLLPIIAEPIHMRECLGFRLQHLAPKNAPAKGDVTVEVQYLIKEPYLKPIEHIFRRP